jgi:hypothetical protein
MLVSNARAGWRRRSAVIDGGPVLLRTIVGEVARFQDDGAQLGETAAVRVVEVDEREAGPGHRVLQQRDRQRPWQAVLVAQMQKSADKAATAVTVVIAAARPVAVVGKMLEYQVEQLHRLRDVRFGHGLGRSDRDKNSAYHRRS